MRTDIPVALERIDIGDGNASMQVALDILKVFGFLAVDIAGEVEVELVLLDLLEADHARVFRDLGLLVEDIHNLVDVLGSRRRFLGPSFMKPSLASIMKMPLRLWASSLSITIIHAGMPVP